MNKLLTVSQLSFSYGKHRVLEDINLKITEDDFIAIIGPNGSGKTTLLKLLLGFLEPTRGKIIRAENLRIGYVPQRYTVDKNFPGTVEEILYPFEHEKRLHLKRIDTLKDTLKEIKVTNKNMGAKIAEVKVNDLLHKKFMDLSGGQQQRVLIALALQKNPNLLILDEPTAGIDIQTEQAFYLLLKELNKKGITIILVTHEVGLIPTLVKTVFCLNHKICCVGKPKDIPKLLKQMYGPQFTQHHHGENHHD